MNDGGQAFPVSAIYDGCRQEVNRGDAYVDLGGMTLRDYFAAKALQGFCGSLVRNYDAPKNVAAMSFAYADAMIAAREKGVE